jgi:molybdopterin molybdotransferase
MSGGLERLHADEPTPFDEAVRIVREHALPLESEEVGLEEAQGRTLAQRIVAAESVPPFDNSTVDGYAVRSADLKGVAPGNPIELAVLGEVMAGEARLPEIRPGCAVRIMTGAPIPPRRETSLWKQAASSGAPTSGFSLRSASTPSPFGGVRSWRSS